MANVFAQNRLAISGANYDPDNRYEFKVPVAKLTFVVQGESLIFQVATDQQGARYGPPHTTEMELLPGTHTRTFVEPIHGFKIRSRSDSVCTVWFVAYPMEESFA